MSAQRIAHTASTVLRAAYCDVDGTLAKTTIVTPLVWFKRKLQNPVWHRLWLSSLCVRGPWWLVLDKISRDASNRAIYASYAGMDFPQLKTLARECYDQCIRPRLFPQAIERVKALGADGVKIVLVSGNLDFLLQPLADELGAEIIAPCLSVTGDVCAGGLSSPPLAGRHKADAVREHAQKHDIDLAQSYAFGDAPGDLAMLECVGHPVVVNPGSRLARIARERGWRSENWGVEHRRS